MALRITTAHYYTADGRDIDGKGLEPDIVLEQDSDEIRERIDVLSKDQLISDPWISRALSISRPVPGDPRRWVAPLLICLEKICRWVKVEVDSRQAGRFVDSFLLELGA